jgi:hypothetical protein
VAYSFLLTRCALTVFPIFFPRWYRAKKAIADSLRAIGQSREPLVGSITVHPTRVRMPTHAPQAITIGSSISFVSRLALDRADEELRHAELEYGRALLGLGCV